MGNKESKLAGISHEEAVKKVTEDEVGRLRTAFKRTSHAGFMNKALFTREVLTDAVPTLLASQIFEAVASNSRGITFRELMMFLVILTRGSLEQRSKLLFHVCSADGEQVTYQSLDALIVACDGRSPAALGELFKAQPRHKKGSSRSQQQDQQQQSETSDSVEYVVFSRWAAKHHRSVSFMHWLLGDEAGTQPSLSDNSDTPTFYQIMAGMTKLSDTEVQELERRYWNLKGASKTGRLDLETLTPFVTPPLPECVCRGFYGAMDTNGDGHLDLKEMSCAIALCCRSAVPMEKIKFCFRMFDVDRDNELSSAEQECLWRTLALVEYSFLAGTGAVPEDSDLAERMERIKADIATAVKREPTDEAPLSLDDFGSWATESKHIRLLIRVLVELCIITLGLRPKTPAEEGTVLRGRMRRDHLLGLPVNTTWYLISNEWFSTWLDHTGYGKASSPHSSSQSPGGGGSESTTTTTKGASTQYTAVSVARGKDAAAAGGDGNKRKGSLKSGNGGGGVSASGSVASADDGVAAGLGPIENAALCVPDSRKMSMIITTEGGLLKRGLQPHKEFTYVSEPVWKALLAWYNGGPALPRTVIQGSEGPGLELSLLNVKFYRHTTNNQVGRSGATTAVNTMWAWAVNFFSSSSGVASMAAYYPTSASSAANNSSSSSSAMSQPPLPRRYPAYFASLSRKMTLAQLQAFLQKALFLKPDDFRLWMMKEESPTSLLEDETLTLEKLQEGRTLLLEVRNKDLTWPEEILSFAAAAKSKKEKEKKVAVSVHVEQGLTGLSNLGNTCFMNSAVQSISNTQPLSLYFCGNQHLDELNRTNPLGMKGNVAKRYADLVQDLWSGTSKSIAPFKFRLTLGRYAPRFNTFQQQDAQELLAFLLDGLHEDLNRITNKPYLELEDSEGRIDEVVAKEAWDYHQKRNQSVIVDLFHGQLKSSVRCLACGHTNNRFDPFTFLSLPLPMENTVYLEVILVRMDGGVPLRYAFRLNPESRYSALKEALSEETSVPVTQLLLVEVFGATLRSVMPDSNKIRHALSGTLYAFEVPAVTLIEPTDRWSSYDQIHATERLEALSRQSAAASPADEERRTEASAEELTSERESRTHAQATSNEPTDGAVRTGSISAAAEASAAEASPSAAAEASPSAASSSAAASSAASPAAASSAASSSAAASPAAASSAASAAAAASPAVASTCAVPEGFEVIDDGEVARATTGGAALAPATSLPPPAASSSGTASSASPTAAGAPASPLLRSPEFDGFIFAVHRKSYFSDMYFLAHTKSRPQLFGVPVAVTCDRQTTRQELYQTLLKQLNRLLATPDPDIRLEEGDVDYPFVLKGVRKDGMTCSQCPWWKFCSGCVIANDEELFDRTLNTYIAIDWDSTALHLRYQNSQERALDEHESVKKAQECFTESISLEECLEAFTKEEELGDEELWFCSKCKKHQRAMKKLDIWKLPPILIVHLKRFQFVNGQWVKSQKTVNYPIVDFSPPSLCQVRPLSPESSNGTPPAAENVTSSPDVTRSSPEHGAADHDSHANGEVVNAPESDAAAVTSSPPGNGLAGNGEPGSGCENDGSDPIGSRQQAPVAEAEARDGSGSAAAGGDAENSDNTPPSVHRRPSEAVEVASDPLRDEVALQQITQDIAREGLEDRLAADEKIDEKTLALAQLNEVPAPCSSTSTSSSTTATSTNGHSPSSKNTATSSAARATDKVNGVSPSQSTTDSTASRKFGVRPTMAERLGNTDQPPTYNLYSMTTHQGMLGGGHYVTFACNPNGKWYCYNDSSCKEVDRARVEEESPYLMFYESSSIDYAQSLKHAKRSGRAAENAGADEEDEIDKEYDSKCSIM